MATEFNYTKSPFNGDIFIEGLTSDLLSIMDNFILRGDALTVKFTQDLTAQEETDLQTALDGVSVTTIQWKIIRIEQTKLIEAYIWPAQRYEWQVIRNVIPRSNTDEEYDAILDYMQEVRDVDTQPDPFNITWPEVP